MAQITYNYQLTQNHFRLPRYRHVSFNSITDYIVFYKLWRVLLTLYVFLGINPESIEGTRTGVYVGVSFRDIDTGITLDRPEKAICLNFASFTYANLASWSLDLQGSSINVDTGCSSSLSALQMAISDMESGKCEYAIVAAVNPLVSLGETIWFNEFKTLSSDGYVRHMDVNANGFVRSEAVVAIYIEPLTTAKRVYGEVMYVTNGHNGTRHGGAFAPSAEAQRGLLTEAYSHAGINTRELVLFECHGTGTVAGDKAEAIAIVSAMLEGRQDPLLIGSVKSNLGHTEAAAGLCSLIKVLLAGQHGVIPANLHFQNPIPEIRDDRIRVVDSNVQFDGGITGLSSFGVGGTIAHAIFKIPEGPTTIVSASLNLAIPRLIPLSARNEFAVGHMIKYIEEHRDVISDDFLGLLTNYAKCTPSKGLTSRATITINKTSGPFLVEQENEIVNDRPVWLILSGMGGQWPTMARGLIDLPFFAKTLTNCADILTPFGLDLLDILLNSDTPATNSIFNFVGITAVQLAIIDLLTLLQVEVDGLIGFSLGEIAAGYADGCLDLQQAMLAAYYRGKCVEEAVLPQGLMAAVHLTWEQALKQCPGSIIPVCHISKTATTVSGPKHEVERFIADLKARDIFAQVVPTNGVAYHSPTLHDVGVEMQTRLQEIFVNPKRRTKKWLSTSVRSEQDGGLLGVEASASYFVNNFLSPVYFHEALKKVPSGAIVVEVGPHGLFKSAVSQTVGKDAIYVTFMRKNSSRERSIELTFQAISRLHLSGVKMNVEKLYPTVSSPVAKGTLSISPLIKWDHSEQWPIQCYPNQFNPDTASDYAVDIDLNNLTFAYLSGHMVDGKCIYPAAGYVRLMWETIARSVGKYPEQIAVTLEDVVFERATIITNEKITRLAVRLNSISGHATVIDGKDLVMSARIKIITPSMQIPTDGSQLMGEVLNSNETYKELRCRGYDYSGLFQSIKALYYDGNQALVEWNNNWIPFLDSFLQVLLLLNSQFGDDRKLQLPSRIRKIIINPVDAKLYTKSSVNVTYDEKTDVVRSEAVQIYGLTVRPMDHHKNPAEVLEAIRFEPYLGSELDSSRQCYLEKCASEIHRKLLGSISEKKCFQNDLLGLITNVDISSGDRQATEMKLIAMFEQNNEKIQDELHSWFINDDRLTRQIIDVVGENAPNQCVILDVSRNNLSSEMARRIRTKTENAKIFDGSNSGHDVAIVVDNVVEEKILHEQYQVSVTKLNADGFLVLVISEKLNLIEEYLFPQLRKSVWKKTEMARQLANDHNLSLICDKFDGISKRVQLFRKQGYRKHRLYVHVSTKDYKWLDEAKHNLAQNDNTVWFISTNEPDSGLLGFINCLRKEPGKEHIRCLFAPCHASITESEFADTFDTDLVVNCFVNGKNGRFTRITLPEPVALKTHAVAGAVRTLGDLSSLHWKQSPEKATRSCDTVDVQYFSLNFRDPLLAMGRIQFADPERKTLFMEYSGIKTNGERVMGINGRVVSTKMNLYENDFVWKVPDHWSLEDAATVPIVYTTAIIALIQRGQLKTGESILIHAGAGGVGQAAISIAQHLNCNIFVTVGSQEKREFLVKTFGLKSENIFNSRDISFESDLMEATNCLGVDMVLNSLADEMLQASLRCLAQDGRFIEIGKADILKNSTIGMAIFEKGASFISVMVDALAYNMTRESHQHLTSLIQAYITDNVVKPLTRTVFQSNNIEDAFRYLAKGDHIGKILIEMGGDIERLALPSISFYPDKVYLIVGGLGGFGLELMLWMSKRGAGKFAVTSRNGSKTAYQNYSIHRLRKNGVQVITSKLDVSVRREAQKVLKLAEEFGALGGIFITALVLRDGLFENLNIIDFEEVCALKALGTKNLDDLSRSCKELDYFVCFSSVVAGFGNQGQTNYGYANSVMDRICERRRKASLHGLSIQWGAIADVGFLADSAIKVKNFGAQRIYTCLSMLEESLKSQESLVTSFSQSVPSEDTKRNLVVSSPVEKIAHLLGQQNATKMSESMTLEALGMSSLVALEVQQVINGTSQSRWSLKDIRHFTMSKIRNLLK